MKGKIAFVVGAAVGYVLGSRAGRERYEQIKRGAETLWQTEPVQRGVDVVKGLVDNRVDEVKAFVRRASADAFANFASKAGAQGERPAGSGGGRASAADSAAAKSDGDEASSDASTEGRTKPKPKASSKRSSGGASKKASS